MEYEVALNQIDTLIQTSHSCRQFISMESFNSRLSIRSAQWYYRYSDGKRWKSRQGHWMDNWAIPTGMFGCPCSLSIGE